MPDSPKELQDAVPRRRERLFVVAVTGSTFAKPGHLAFKAFREAKADADARNHERVLGQLRKKAVGGPATVFVVYLRRKKDADFGTGAWRLARRTELHVMDADDVLAFSVQDAMMSGG